jgi:putative phosphoribosyl transferase
MAPERSTVEERGIRIPARGVTLAGDLTIPQGAAAIVLFAHGSGSSRHSPRNRMVAARLVESGLATVLLDLLTRDEDEADLRTGRFRFDVPLLAGRLAAATEEMLAHPDTRHLRIGYFGASTGAAAALVAAAALPDSVGAIVSRGGRPDLAGDALGEVAAPTLLIVGGDDDVVVELNRQAYERLQGEKRLEIIPGATHLFAEPGALEAVAGLASIWFRHFLVSQPESRTTLGTPPSSDPGAPRDA